MSFVSPITALPAAPNIGSPATVAALASAFVAAQATFASQMNTAAGQINTGAFGAPFATYGGTANAITLTTGASLTSIADRQQVRFRATATNTGATTFNIDGTGAVSGVTVTGVALPSGYIRTGVDTLITRTGEGWVVERATEKGSNANGVFTRYDDGTLECYFLTNIADISVATGVDYVSPDFTFPATFSGPSARTYFGYPTNAGGARSNACSLEGDQQIPTTIWRFRMRNGNAIFTITRIIYLEMTATGRWY